MTYIRYTEAVMSKRAELESKIDDVYEAMTQAIVQRHIFKREPRSVVTEYRVVQQASKQQEIVSCWRMSEKN